jgi:PAS domain S-box-containing protein
MKDEEKTKVRLIEDLTLLRRQLVQLRDKENKTQPIAKDWKGGDEFHRLAMEYSNDGIVVISKTQRLFANKKYVEMLGFTNLDELQKIPFLSIVHPDDLNIVKDYSTRRQRGEYVPAKYECRFIAKNGSIINVEISASLIDYQGKNVSLKYIRNITERKLKEEERKQSEERYRIVLDEIDEGYHEVDLRGSFTFFNDALIKIVGYPREELLGMNFRKITEAEEANKVFQAYNKMFSTEKALKKFEWTFIRKDGTPRTAENSVSLIRDANGRVIGFRGVARDVTERKQIEEQYRIIANSSQVGVYILQRGKICITNPQITRYFGYTADELRNKEMLDLVHPEDREMVREKAIEMLKGKTSLPYEYRIIDKSGKVGWQMEKVTPIIYEGERAVLGNIMDITEQKMLEEERHRLESQLRQAQKMEAIGTLAGGIAHDFNNVLGAIIGYAELIGIVADPDKRQYYLDQILNSCGRAKDMVTQILAFSRQKEQERKTVSFTAIVEEGIKLLRSFLPSTIQINQKVTMKSLNILADSTQIHQVLMNLCTNAAHAMRERGGILDIRLSHEKIDTTRILYHGQLSAGSYARLTVSDNGHGIETSIMERIFDPFFTTKGPGEGTGLGLSMVYGIIRDHFGAIDVQSEPGKGTTFSIYLPVIEVAGSTAEHDFEPIPVGNEKILFVDDETALIEVGQSMLTSLGYQVTAMSNSSDALELFQENKNQFDLVITDMTMPSMRGDHFARELLKIRSDIPIILCTGFSDVISEDKAKKIGIRKFIMKPLFKRDLARAIREVL